MTFIDFVFLLLILNVKLQKWVNKKFHSFYKKKPLVLLLTSAGSLQHSRSYTISSLEGNLESYFVYKLSFFFFFLQLETLSFNLKAARTKVCEEWDTGWLKTFLCDFSSLCVCFYLSEEVDHVNVFIMYIVPAVSLLFFLNVLVLFFNRIYKLVHSTDYSSTWCKVFYE